MGLTGIALLPPPEVRQAIVDFQHENADCIDGPELGMDENLPHTSILQCPFDEALNRGALLAHLAGHIRQGDAFMQLGHLYYQPSDWIFGALENRQWLFDLQMVALQLSEVHIDRSRISQRTQPGLTIEEQVSYERYGYRYVGSCYRPHITIGRTPNRTESLPEGLAGRFADSGLVGMTFEPAAIAFYRAGESGSFAESLAWLDL